MIVGMIVLLTLGLFIDQWCRGRNEHIYHFFAFFQQWQDSLAFCHKRVLGAYGNSVTAIEFSIVLLIDMIVTMQGYQFVDIILLVPSYGMSISLV